MCEFKLFQNYSEIYSNRNPRVGAEEGGSYKLGFGIIQTGFDQ